MNSHIVKSLLAAALVAGASAAASAQELKIGYVNSDRVLRDAVPAKAAQAKLEAEFSKREKDLNELANKLKAASDRLDKDAPTLGEAERTRRSASWSTRTAICSAVAASSRKTSASARTRSWRRSSSGPTASSSRSSRPRSTTSSSRRPCSRVLASTSPTR